MSEKRLALTAVRRAFPLRCRVVWRAAEWTVMGYRRTKSGRIQLTLWSDECPVRDGRALRRAWPDDALRASGAGERSGTQG